MLGLNGLYTALAPSSLRPAAGYAILVVCLWISVCDLAFITYTKWMGLCSSSSYVCVCGQSVWYSARFITFQKECYYRAKKHFTEDLILPQLLLDNLSNILEDIYQWKRRFCKRNKNCEARKNRAKVKDALRKVTILQIRGNHMGKRYNAEFRTFYWKSRGETNSIWPNKSVINNRTFFGGNFFEMLCKETNLYYFQIKENMLAVLRG
jgi:hypothetical protein